MRDLSAPWGPRRTASPLSAPIPRPDALPAVAMTAPGHLLPEQQSTIEETNFVADTMKYGDFVNLPLSIGVESARILERPPTRRIFLCIVNNHATQSMFITFGTPSSAALGLKLLPGGALTLDAVVPQNDIHMISDGANTNGALVYCNKEIGQH